MIEKHWIGQYGYSFENPEEESCAFEIKVNYTNGSFQGTAWEAIFSENCDLPIHVKGFIEDDLISFIKTYPCLYAEDEEGTTFIDENLPGHQVVYQGYFDEESGNWSGQWEIILSGERDKSVPGAYTIKYISGPWNMKSESSLL